MYVSRGNLGDVIAMDLTNPGTPIKWRTRVNGFKADHDALSSDGKRYVVSATVVDQAEVLDTATGNVIGTFTTGHYPHQNEYSANGAHIYNASIGDVNSPYAQNATKGARQLTEVDANTLQPIRVYPFDYGLRPMVITPDETLMYAQLSYLAGVIKYDLTTGTILQTVTLPATDVRNLIYPTYDDYPHDSAHHGLAMSGDSTKLCEAGTIDDDVSILSIPALTVNSTVHGGLLPYWATTSVDGSRCFVSNAGSGDVSVFDYQTGQEVVRVRVGIYPARIHLAHVHENQLSLLSKADG